MTGANPTEPVTWRQLGVLGPANKPGRWPQLILPGIAVAVLVTLHWYFLALMVIVLGLTLMVGSLVSVQFAARRKQFEHQLSQGSGALIRALLLVPFFIIVLAPLAWTQRLFRRDLLHRNWESEAPSYWFDHYGSSDYERPY